MYYARIKDGIVQDVIVLEDESLESLFSQGFDHMIDLGESLEAGDPSVGWLYDEESEEFSAP